MVQFQYSSAGVNQARSFRIEAIAADASGVTYIGGQSSDQMPERAALAINGAPIGTWVSNETSLIGVAGDFASRVQVASFTASGGGAGTITALASANGKLAILATTDGDIVTVAPLDGTRSDSDVFLAVSGTAVAPPPGFTVTPTTGLSVTESGTTASFSVVLDSQPTGDVSFNIASSDTGEASVSPISLAFGTANWNTPQPVTVTDDDATVPSGITVTPDTGLVVGEDGSSASFDVLLDSEPTATVSIGLSSSDPAEGDIDVTTLSFGTADWMMARTVTVTGVDDTQVDGDIAFSIVTAPAQSDDPAYAGLDPADVAVTNLDNDGGDPPTPGFSLSPPGDFTVDGATTTASFTVVLDSAPASEVVFTITTSDPGVTDISPASLSFTPENWDQSQTVTVAMSSTVPPPGVTVAVEPTTSDDGYDDLPPQNVVMAPGGVAPVAIPTLREPALLVLALLLMGLAKRLSPRSRG